MSLEFDRNEKVLIAALEASSDGILISDDKGNVLYVNSAYEETTGLKKRQMIGKNLRDLLEDKVFNMAASLSVLEDEKTVSIMHKYVTGKKALTTASPIYDEYEKIIGVVCNTRNISELIKLKSELNESKMLTQKYSDELKKLRELQMQCKDIVFKSKVMGEILEFASKAACFDSTVLIYGQSGSGKEVLAKFIHQQSNRKNGPFIKVNCAAIPNELFESEFFGYDPGSFTGAAQKGKPGLFELANDGTILLDEVGELPLVVQSKLLRLIQEREFFRLGASKSVKINVRILAATNKDLLDEVKKGNFREDLYFRLNVIPIKIPSLSERREDISELAMHFIENLNRRYKKNVTISPESLDIMTNYSWPGNIRELQNLIEYLFITNTDGEIGIELLPPKLLTERFLLEKDSKNKKTNLKLEDMMAVLEKNIIISTLKNHTSLRKAAISLGINVSTLSRKIKKYEIEPINMD